MKINRYCKTFRTLAVVFIALGLMAAGTLPASAETATQDANRLSASLGVMTRNMYLGSDLDPVIGAQTSQAFVTAAATAYGQVLASNVPERAAAVAKEIALTHPDIVSLQEVYQWRTGTLLDSAPATNVTVDQLASLQSALSALHLHYAPVVVQVNTDLEAPVPAPGINADVRMTDRDVILARTDLPSSVLKVTNPQKGHYDAFLQFQSPVLGNVAVPRGWVSIDVTHFGRTTRVINTHLESYNSAIPATALIQRAEGSQLLQSVVGTTTSSVILSGDFNSGPSTGAADQPPIDTFNDVLAAGFIDTWTATHSSGHGYTWPMNTGDSRTTATPDQRIDHVFVRGSVQPLADVRTGSEKTHSGFYASDHLGLVATTWLR